MHATNRNQVASSSLPAASYAAVSVHPILAARAARAANQQRTLASLDAAIAKLRASRLVLAGGAR